MKLSRKQLTIIYCLITFVINLWLMFLIYFVVIIKPSVFFPLLPLFLTVAITLFFIEFYFFYNYIFKENEENEQK